MVRLGILLLAAALGLAGCGGEDGPPEALPTARYPIPTPSPTPSPSAPSPTTDPNAPVHLAYGVDLEPGAGGRLPVRVRWTYQGVFPEELAVDRRRHVVYLDDEYGTALDLESGDIIWRAMPDHDGEGLNSDGGDVIGRSGRDGIRFVAPYNYDYTVDRDTGEVTADVRSAIGDPTHLRPFPAPRPRAYRVVAGLHQVVARGADGSPLWRIRIMSADFDSHRPVAVPGGVALLLSTGLLVVLDDR